MIPNGLTSTHDRLAFQYIALTVTASYFLALVVNASNLKRTTFIHLIATLYIHVLFIIRVSHTDTGSVLGAEIVVLGIPDLANDNMGIQNVLQTPCNAIVVGGRLNRVAFASLGVVVINHGIDPFILEPGLIPTETE